VPDPHIQLYISLGALLLAAISLLDKLYGKVAQTQKEFSKELSEVKQELASLKTKIEPFWIMIETNLPAILKQPIHLKMDALLTTYETCRERMTLEQLLDLEDELLKAKEEARIKKDPRTMGYLWMAAVVASRIAEKKSPTPNQKKKVHWYDWLRIS
jgi:ATP-dependent Clp protease ATP-binding subunit ClpA